MAGVAAGVARVVGLRRVLVTGGTGSFGQAFVRHALAQGIPRVDVLSRDEVKQGEMREALGDDRVRFLIGDVRDRDRLAHAFAGVDLVVHAAALKQVAAVEYNPVEAVRTNVLGSMVVAEAAIHAGVRRVVALSTDKAVAPANLYGATKLCAEKLFAQAGEWGGHKTAFVTLRYGNVLGSRGSVVARWRGPGERRGTRPDATRFVWPLAAAVAFAWDRACDELLPRGAVCVPAMRACRLGQLASVLGVAPAWSGELAPGEKLHEALLARYERHEAQPWGWVVHREGPEVGRRVTSDDPALALDDDALRGMLA